MTAPDSDSPIIRASEIGEYVYCSRSWWLRRVEGVASRNTAALAGGQQAHDRHGRQVAGVLRQQRLALVLAALAVLLAVLALIALAGGAR